MSGHFGQIEQPFISTWVNNEGAVSKNQAYSALAPEAIGVFAADDYKNRGELKSLEKPSFTKNKRLILKQGIHKTLGNTNPIIMRSVSHPRETIELTKEDIISWTGIKARKGSVGDIVAFGYDGLDASKDIAKDITLDAKSLYVNMRFSGEPIRRFFGKNYIDHRLVIDKGLCVGDCECFDACGKVDGDLIADKIIKEINTGFLFHQGPKQAFTKFPLNKLLKVSKTKKYATGESVPAIATTEYKKWSIVLPTHTTGALAKLAEKVPGITIEFDSVTPEGTVYSAWTPMTTTSLASVTLTDYLVPVCDTCPDCPVDSTKVDGVKNVQVRVACGADAPTMLTENPDYDSEVEGSEEFIPVELSSALISSDLIGGDVYILKFPLTTTDDSIQEWAEDQGCSLVDIIGDEGSYCVAGSTTFAWTHCETAFTTKKNYQLVLLNHHCDRSADRLEELQAAYPNLVISLKEEGDCIAAYETTIESDKLPEEECEREFGTFTFVAPASYQGFLWTPSVDILTEPVCEDPETVEKPCSVTGLIFETARWDEGFEACDFGFTSWSPNLTKPVRLQLNIHSLDYTDNFCDKTAQYSTILQYATYEKGADGRLVQEWEKIQLSYETLQGYTPVPMVNEAIGYKSVTDPTALYDIYSLEVKYKHFDTSHTFRNMKTHVYRFAVQTGKGKQLEALINDLVLSTGNPELKAVIL